MSRIDPKRSGQGRFPLPVRFRPRIANARRVIAVVTLGATLSVASLGCRFFRDRDKPQAAGPAPREFRPSRNPRPPKALSTDRVQSVICLFDQKPWLSADVGGDRDPEGIQYRIFLNAGGNKGVAREGSLHIEMYQFGRDDKEAQTRTMVSDWHYPTSQFPRVSANLLGMGYHVQLRWAKKEIAGNEIEIVTQFEDPDGNITRGATKRLRVPKYSS